jgi:hypothetical protein
MFEHRGCEQRADGTVRTGDVMEQSRLGSLIESIMNIAIGYVVALLSQIVIFPIFDIHVSITTNMWIGAWFTGISLIRSYVIRRWFNARLHSVAVRMAGNS